MPPFAYSRYKFCRGVKDDKAQVYLTEREPYGFAAHDDNRVHLVVQGDTLWSLAARYFDGLPRACGFWWVIADFQDPPIIDPTLQLEPGTKLVIPSVRVLTDVILSPSRRRSHG